MPHRHRPLPRLWLLTDERQADPLAAVSALPFGSGVIVRHRSLSPRARRRLLRAVLRVARRRGHVVLLADRPARARSWGAHGAHDRSAHASRGLRTAPIHTPAERAAARRVRADRMLVSPLYPTRSHPGRVALGRVRAGLLAGPSRGVALALGGMTVRRARALATLGFAGWAAIDALSVDALRAGPRVP